MDQREKMKLGASTIFRFGTCSLGVFPAPSALANLIKLKDKYFHGRNFAHFKITALPQLDKMTGALHMKMS